MTRIHRFSTTLLLSILVILSLTNDYDGPKKLIKCPSCGALYYMDTYHICQK